MNPQNSAWTETNPVNVTCIVPATGTGPCSQWRFWPSSTYLATDGTTGVITITYTSAAGGLTLIMEPQSGGQAMTAGTVPTGGSVNWACTSGTTLSKYRFPPNQQ